MIASSVIYSNEHVPVSPLSMSLVQDAFVSAGVTMNGTQPWDPQIHDQRFEARVLAQGSLGLGESYMDGWWDCEQLDGMIERLIRADVGSRVPRNIRTAWHMAKAKVLNQQSRSRAFHIGQFHYDLGNDLYSRMLDARLTYSCGYWKNASTLDDAQTAKLDLICRKIGLQAGQHVVDIGCGWGSFAQYAAEHYGARVTGITVSREQATLARERCRGLPVEIRLMDYRDLQGTYDHVVSVGMFEHVGARNYRTFFRTARRVLKEDGLLLLHTIGARGPGGPQDPWIIRYIFPGGEIPVDHRICQAYDSLFLLEDWHNFGPYYSNTLLAWNANCERAWPELDPQKYNQRFRRMWRYYLMSCAGAFRARSINLWQLVLSPHGVEGGYRGIR